MRGRLSMALLWAGSFPAAPEVAQAGLQRGSGLAADHPAVLTLRVYRANAQRSLGRYADAEAEYRQVLATLADLRRMRGCDLRLCRSDGALRNLEKVLA